MPTNFLPQVSEQQLTDTELCSSIRHEHQHQLGGLQAAEQCMKSGKLSVSFVPDVRGHACGVCLGQCDTCTCAAAERNGASGKHATTNTGNSTAAHLLMVAEGSPFKEAAKTGTWLESLRVVQHGKGLLQPVPRQA